MDKVNILDLHSLIAQSQNPKKHLPSDLHPIVFSLKYGINNHLLLRLGPNHQYVCKLLAWAKKLKSGSRKWERNTIILCLLSSLNTFPRLSGSYYFSTIIRFILHLMDNEFIHIVLLKYSTKKHFIGIQVFHRKD